MWATQASVRWIPFCFRGWNDCVVGAVMSVLEQPTLFTIAGCCTVILHSVCCLVVIVGAQWLNPNSHAELQVFRSTCKRAHILQGLISSYIVPLYPNRKNKCTNQLDRVRNRGIKSSGHIRTKLEFKSPMSCVYWSKIRWLGLGCFLGSDFNWWTPASHWVSLFYNPFFAFAKMDAWLSWNISSWSCILSA